MFLNVDLRDYSSNAYFFKEELTRTQKPIAKT